MKCETTEVLATTMINVPKAPHDCSVAQPYQQTNGQSGTINQPRRKRLKKKNLLGATP
jgi:hypothetical protein